MSTDSQRRTTTRTDLLSAIAQVFEAQGYDGATLNALAAATGLGKASLYHHFPGGKPEMAAILLRGAVAALEKNAYSHLSVPGPARQRLAAFIDGFRDYVAHGERACLVTILAQGSLGAVHGGEVAARFTDWQARLAVVYEEAGLKPKAARRAAAELLACLYGSLLLTRLGNDPDCFRRQARRLKKSLP